MWVLLLFLRLLDEPRLMGTYAVRRLESSESSPSTTFVVRKRTGPLIPLYGPLNVGDGVNQERS